jgi:hypothetical protein
MECPLDYEDRKNIIAGDIHIDRLGVLIQNQQAMTLQVL